MSTPISSINAFIDGELARLEAFATGKQKRDDAVPALNALFMRTLAE